MWLCVNMCVCVRVCVCVGIGLGTHHSSAKFTGEINGLASETQFSTFWHCLSGTPLLHLSAGLDSAFFLPPCPFQSCQQQPHTQCVGKVPHTQPSTQLFSISLCSCASAPM